MMAALRFRELPALVPGKRDCFMADPRKIVVDPDYNCRDMKSADTKAHVEWLAESIAMEGFTSILEVTRRGEDLVLRRGHCRLAATLIAIERGVPLEGVPVMQMEGNDEIDLLFDQQTSNTGLRLDGFAKGRMCIKARRFGVADDEIARRMHWKAINSVKDHIALLDMPKDLKQQVRDGLISETAALKLWRDTQTPDALKAQIIQDAADEQKRLGKKGKATPKAIQRASERANPKPPAAPKITPEPETSAPLASGLPGTNETEGAPVEGVESLDQLQEQIAGLTGADKASGTANVTQFRSDMLPHDMAADMGLAPEATAPAEIHREYAERDAARASSKIRSLLHSFADAEIPAALALQYAKLCRELEETKAESGDVMQGQEEICAAADVAGRLLFPDEWDNAKATTELAQVA